MSDDEYADDFEEYDGDNSKVSEHEHKQRDDDDGDGGDGDGCGSALADVTSSYGGDGGAPRFEAIDFRDVTMGKQVGGGGVGIVYEGYFQGRAVALKTLFDPRVDDALKREYTDELHVMARLRHPNVVRFDGACVEPPNLCFVMELCEHSLYQRLHQPAQCGTEEVDERTAAELLLGTAQAMLYLHDEVRPAIVHRDLKSHNVLVDGAGVAKLCDFGLVGSKVVSAGTPAYMAPELLEGTRGAVSRKADVYAFGIMLWEALSREVPWDGCELEDIRRNVCELEARPGVPRARASSGRAGAAAVADLYALAARCWAPRSAERPEFREVVAEMRAAIAELPAASRGGLDSIELLDAAGGFGDDALASLMRK